MARVSPRKIWSAFSSASTNPTPRDRAKGPGSGWRSRGGSRGSTAARSRPPTIHRAAPPLRWNSRFKSLSELLGSPHRRLIGPAHDQPGVMQDPFAPDFIEAPAAPEPAASTTGPPAQQPAPSFPHRPARSMAAAMLAAGLVIGSIGGWGLPGRARSDRT